MTVKKSKKSVADKTGTSQSNKNTQTVRFIQLNVRDILLGAYAFFVIGIVIGLWIERD